MHELGKNNSNFLQEFDTKEFLLNKMLGRNVPMYPYKISYLKDARNLEVRIIIPWMFDCCVRDSHWRGQRKINIAIPSTQPSNFNFHPMRPGEE